MSTPIGTKNHNHNLDTHLSDPNQMSTSNFTLNLIQSDSQFSPANLVITEVNAFRQITHLSLKLIQGDDSDIKEYLAECLQFHKDSLEKTTNELNNTRSNLTNN